MLPCIKDIFAFISFLVIYIMVNICHNMADAAERYDAKGNYVLGANIAGFEKVAEAMTAQGIV